MTKASNAFDRQAAVRRYGASLGLIAVALLLSRFVTPSGASSPLVLLGATAAVAYFGGFWPALAATAAAAIVNGVGIGLEDWPRLAVESSMIVLLGVVLAFRASRSIEAVQSTDAVPGEAFVTKPPTPDLEALSAEVDAKSSPPAITEVKTLTVARHEHSKSDEDAGACVLVVHGNGVLRLALRSTLSGLGYSVRDAANLATAEPMLASQRFDAVVIDLGRVDEPNLNSIERVRKLLSAPDESIVALANIEHEDDRELLMAAGADLVLAKPIDTAGVAAKLRGLLPPPKTPVQSRVGLGASP